MKSILLIVVFFLSLPVLASDADTVFVSGLEMLRLAQSDASKLVPATKLLAKAESLYESEGNDTKCAEVNSCLYWAKKKLTLADIESVKDNVIVSRKLESASAPVAASDAQKWLDRADAFSGVHADDPLLIAIHYFEIADRFKDSDVGRKAMDASLKSMQRVKAPQRITQVITKQADKPFDPTHVDYSSLTAAQWESVNAQVFRVQAKRPLDTKIDVVEGQEFVLIPHPDDRWYAIAVDSERRYSITDFKGFCEATGKIDERGILGWRLAKDTDNHQYDMAVSGRGRIYLRMAVADQNVTRGEIRVKIVRVK